MIPAAVPYSVIYTAWPSTMYGAARSDALRRGAEARRSGITNRIPGTGADAGRAYVDSLGSRRGRRRGGDGRRGHVDVAATGTASARSQDRSGSAAGYRPTGG